MKMMCIGVSKSEGTFNDKPYCNYLFYFTDTEDRSRIAGVVPYSRGSKLKTYKVKVSEFPSDLQPSDYVNREVSLTYDAYGNISAVTLI